MMIIFPSLHPERFMWQVLMFPCVMGGLQQYIIFMSRIEYSHTTLPLWSTSLLSADWPDILIRNNDFPSHQRIISSSGVTASYSILQADRRTRLSTKVG